ncbi:MAG: hypothetical protein GFH27_549285n33 [Chloroflexi bacterium AL-W]|nr:hypothetical protein [Chloroflexi bacterium AL-N1]NOK65545.1 hypothetical protein [Chloroflexi bacterium AL-N10]NOK74513.1 hypothetical protein [Chloroflexi bacterium AL-N5]NOK80578.1 hypothetical protein [Chloroflexi bacterium AL-W]NOK88771.1 hypothetical protein [Chloroflexi bacterium AL-N15]
MSIDFTISSQLAADLAGKVDPNEASKALAYLRSRKDGRALFDYLQTIEQHGKAVIRSHQTLRYYQEMHEAFKHHLSQFQDNPEKMAETLGWAIRLLRYYRAVPDYQPNYTTQKEKRVTRSEAQKIPPPVGPEVGDVVTGQIIRLHNNGAADVKLNRLPDNFVGVLRKADAKGRRSGGIRGEVIKIAEEDGTVYLVLKPVKRPKE